jgi:hypothetical protein
MKAPSKSVGSRGNVADDCYDHSHSHHRDQEDHDHNSHGHNHQTGTAEYVRLGVMGIIVVASMTG